MARLVCFLILAGIFVVWPGAALAQVPLQLNYQAQITDPNGEPLNGEILLGTSIWDLPQGGALLYREEHVITLENGIFSILLGTGARVDGVFMEFGTGIFGESERYLEIAIDGDINSAAVQGAIERLQDRLRSDPDFVGRSRLQVNPAGDLALLTVAIAGETASDQAIEAVERLRAEYIPQAFAGWMPRPWSPGSPPSTWTFSTSRSATLPSCLQWCYR